MKSLFQLDGVLFQWMTRIGHLVLLSIFWVIGCLPIITIGASTAALYYATVKSVRRGRSYVWTEFWQAYKRNLFSGSLVTVGMLLLLLFFYMNRTIFQNTLDLSQRRLLVIFGGLLILLGATLMYLFPVMSRFQMKLLQMIGLSFVMCLRFIPTTVMLLFATVLTVWAQIMILPWPLIFLVPAVLCYLNSYLIERVLKVYMKKPADVEDAWYYE